MIGGTVNRDTENWGTRRYRREREMGRKHPFASWL